MVLRKLVIIPFFFFHAIAVGAYSVPRETEDAFSVWTRGNLVPIVQPYLFWTSQWQQWNLFAPNPLRRVTRYTIEERRGNTWQQIALLSYDTIPWWRDADELKILRHTEQSGELWKELQRAYLAVECRDRALAPGTALRMAYHSAIIPYLAEPRPIDDWLRWNPSWETEHGVSFYCGP